MRTGSLSLLLIAFAISGCTSLKQVRTELNQCRSAAPVVECQSSALQEVLSAGNPGAGYFLGFVEFDDQGQLFSRDQMRAVMDAVYAQAARTDEDYLNVVFVHGWKHGAREDDSNVATFRQALARLNASEQAASVASGLQPRKIMGIYLGWRGKSITIPVLKELTFWDRKHTAHEVGHGDVTEVLQRLDLIRQQKDALTADKESRSRLVIVGHSFGGAVVHSALTQILGERFLRTNGAIGNAGGVNGFGNLVVLINPAFEAQLYSPMSNMSLERGSYPRSQLPVLAVMTSEADWATKVAFPLGRKLSTLFEKTRKVKRRNPVSDVTEVIDEADADVTAIGHFEPYRTHYLSSTPEVATSEPGTPEDVRMLASFSSQWEGDAPGNIIQFPGMKLQRTDNSAGRNPYLIIKVDRQLIRGHNDLSNPKIIDFINDLILVTGQSTEMDQRNEERKKMYR